MGANTRTQFPNAEWLGDIVIGAGIQPHLFLGFLRPRSQENDGRADTSATQFPAHVETVQLWQHHVEQDQVPLTFATILYGLFTIACDAGLIALSAKVLLQAENNIGFVFDNQYACHKLTPS